MCTETIQLFSSESEESFSFQKSKISFHIPSNLPVQIPGFRSVHAKTVSVFDKVAECGQNIKNLVAVDEDHFPRKSTRFTAIYSRDKEYL